MVNSDKKRPTLERPGHKKSMSTMQQFQHSSRLSNFASTVDDEAEGLNNTTQRVDLRARIGGLKTTPRKPQRISLAQTTTVNLSNSDAVGLPGARSTYLGPKKLKMIPKLSV